MAKRKIIVETLTHYIFRHQMEDGTIYEGTLKINGDYNTAEVDNIKSNKNAGGEAWDWAQRSWPEFIKEEGPSITVDLGDGETLIIPSTLRWACVSGVYDMKMNHLPIQEVNYSTARNTGYAKAQKEKRGKTTPKFKAVPPFFAQDKPESTPRRGVGVRKTTIIQPDKVTKKSQRKLSAVEKLTQGTDVEAVKQKNIQKAMLEEN
jgi:hypothetical protein